MNDVDVAIFLNEGVEEVSGIVDEHERGVEVDFLDRLFDSFSVLWRNAGWGLLLDDGDLCLRDGDLSRRLAWNADWGLRLRDGDLSRRLAWNADWGLCLRDGNLSRRLAWNGRDLAGWLARDVGELRRGRRELCQRWRFDDGGGEIARLSAMSPRTEAGGVCAIAARCDGVIMHRVDASLRRRASESVVWGIGHGTHQGGCFESCRRCSDGGSRRLTRWDVSWRTWRCLRSTHPSRERLGDGRAWRMSLLGF